MYALQCTLCTCHICKQYILKKPGWHVTHGKTNNTSRRISGMVMSLEGRAW
jgi:hypothetical protein